MIDRNGKPLAVGDVVQIGPRHNAPLVVQDSATGVIEHRSSLPAAIGSITEIIALPDRCACAKRARQVAEVTCSDDAFCGCLLTKLSGGDLLDAEDEAVDLVADSISELLRTKAGV